MRKAKKILLLVGSVLGCIVVMLTAALLIVTHDYSGQPPTPITASENPHIAITGATKISAHRSGGGIEPENTMMAFKNCVENPSFSIDIFEFDIQITKDKELVLLHDETLSRTSDSAEVLGCEDAKPSDFTYEELRQLNMGESFTTDSGETPYKGLRGDAVPEDLRIVRIQDVLDYLTQNGDFAYIIEIKNGGELGRQSCDALHEVLSQYDLLQYTVVGTFHEEISEYISRTYADMVRSASMKEVIGFYFDSLLNRNRPDHYYPYAALQIPDQLVVKLGTTRLINYAHKHHIAVQFWTINDEKTVQELASKGADAILSDFPDMVYHILREKG